MPVSRNPGILENNSVTCIAEDGEGKIWFGTKRGAYILSKTDYDLPSCLWDTHHRAKDMK